jgi:4-hydroxyphenylacetate 3-monooxygenase
MAIRTGEEYLAGLRDDREVYVDGNRVEDVTEGDFGTVAHTFAKLFDLQHQPEYEDALTFEQDGERVDGAYARPRTREELEWRRGLTETVARHTGGIFGRAPEYVPLFLLGMYDIREDFSKGDPAFARHIEDYVKWAADGDKVLSHSFVDVQADPGTPVDETVVPKVVSRNEDGITVRGVKTVATFVPHSDECLVGVLPRAGLQDHHILYFATPIAAPGLRVVAREPYGTGKPFDHPLSAYGDENDSMLIFDDLFVPWERVFSPIEGPAFAAQVFPRITEWAHWDILCRIAVKAELLLGLTALIPEMIGRDKQPQSQEALGEMIRYLTAIRAFVYASEDRGHVTPSGHFMPDPMFVTAGRAHSVELYRRMTGYIQDIASQGLINAPTEDTLANEVIGPTLDGMLTTKAASGHDRTRVTRLAWDLVGDSFGGRQTLFELFNALPWTAQRGQLVARFDAGPYKDLARATAGLGSLADAAESVARAAAKAEVDYDRVGRAYTSYGGARKAGGANGAEMAAGKPSPAGTA